VKTKYTQIVNIKKQIVKKVENELMKINFNIKRIENEIKDIEEEIINSPIPTSGDFALMISMRESVNVYRLEKDRKTEYLKKVELKKLNIEQRLKDANIDYEKMKHLHDNEVLIIQKAMKKKEEEEMNEIAIMLYNNK
jgi:hypothetical protein